MCNCPNGFMGRHGSWKIRHWAHVGAWPPYLRVIQDYWFVGPHQVSRKHERDAWFLFSYASMSTHWAFRRVIRLEGKVFHFSLMMWKRQAWIVLIKANCTASSQFSSPAVVRDSPASTSRKFWRAVALHSGYETFNLGYSAPFWLLLACTLEMVKLFVKRLESKKLVFYYIKAAFLPKMS